MSVVDVGQLFCNTSMSDSALDDAVRGAKQNSDSKRACAHAIYSRARTDRIVPCES